MATTNIDEICEKIKQNFVGLSKEAAKNAAKKAQEDIKNQADKFIKEYYQYSPKLYKHRKNALYKLVEEYWDENETSDGLMIEFGITYNPENIKGIHQSESWWHQSGDKWVSRYNDKNKFHFDRQDNGIPEPEWITEKFWEGLHPSGKLGDNGGIKDMQSPDEKMQAFFNSDLDNKIKTYMNKALLDAVKKYF